jgi:hypothetical protein
MPDHDPLDVRAEERAKKQVEDKQQLARRREIDDFKWLMADERGRRFMWRLLEKAGVFRSSFTGNSETFFREGQRNIGLMLIADIHEACPNDYTRMLKEQRKNDD